MIERPSAKSNQTPNESPHFDAKEATLLRLRQRRVFILLIGIVILSIADLVLTLHHLTTYGMMEANPIAVWVITTTGSPWALGAFKIGTVAISAMLLYIVRKHRIGEFAAWTCAAILTAMCFMWSTYTEELESPATVQLVQTTEGVDNWLRFE